MVSRYLSFLSNPHTNHSPGPSLSVPAMLASCPGLMMLIVPVDGAQQAGYTHPVHLCNKQAIKAKTTAELDE